MAMSPEKIALNMLFNGFPLAKLAQPPTEGSQKGNTALKPALNLAVFALAMAMSAYAATGKSSGLPIDIVTVTITSVGTDDIMVQLVEED